MTHLQKAPRKPLLNVEQGKVFISHLDDNQHKKIAKDIFVDGMTSAEIAEKYFYCERQVERIRIGLLKNVLKKLVEKQIPKKADDYLTVGVVRCPTCNLPIEAHASKVYCCYCGQVLDWGDT